MFVIVIGEVSGLVRGMEVVNLGYLIEVFVGEIV